MKFHLVKSLGWAERLILGHKSSKGARHQSHLSSFLNLEICSSLNGNLLFGAYFGCNITCSTSQGAH